MKRIPPRVKILKKDTKGKIQYKTNPKKINLAIAARSKAQLENLKEQSRVLTLVKKGHTFDEVGEKLGIAPAEALERTKKAIDRWCNELSLNAEQCRELDIKRIDALMVILWDRIEPKEARDLKGNIIIDAATLEPVMAPPDYVAVKLYKELLERRARMLGLDAEQSAIQIQNNIVLERRYIGGDPDKL